MRAGKALLVTTEKRFIWPFPSVNGVQTDASKALQDAPAPPKQSLYESVMSDPETEESLL